MILVDSNLLVRFANKKDPLHTIAQKATAALRTEGRRLCMTSQNLYEFWVVGTRPVAVNGLGLSPSECKVEIVQFRATYAFIPDHPSVYDEWESLVLQHQCKGKVAHDARLVAAMNVHGIGSILTFNTADFQRYPHIAVLDPRTIASQVP